MSLVHFLSRTLPVPLKRRLRPFAYAYNAAKYKLKFPFRVIRIFPYVWRREFSERLQFSSVRKQHEKLYVSKGDPLISIIIPTYNRAALLVAHAIPSILQQTYQNFEVIVVGECCTDDTAVQLAAINDPRIKFHNLPERPLYPANKKHFWMTVAYTAMNTGRRLAQGLWLASLDDDDEWLPEHLEKLLRFAQQHDYEFVSSQSLMEISPGNFRIKGEPPALSMKHKTHCTFFARAYLRLFHYEQHSWRADRSVDKHLLGKYRRAGVRAGFLSEVTARYLLSPDPSVRSMT